MRSSRQSHSSLSSITSERISDRNRSKSHSSRNSVESLRKSNRKMKFIIAVGVALPIIAAIIGVVAWAVSADSAFHGATASSLRRSDANIGAHEEDIFQILEDRQDMTYTRHPSSLNQGSPRSDLSRVDGLQNIHQSSFDDTPEKDPLYIVHFVPSPKPKVPESSTPGPNGASTVSSDVLQKILSASKGVKPGTPQFVVFAPMPSAEDDKGKEEDLTSMGATGLNFLSKPPTPNTELDYEYEEELRKYQELLNNKEDNSLKDPSRIGSSTDNSKTQTQILKESIHLVSQNFSGNIYQNLQPHQPRSVGSNVGLLASEFSQKQQQVHPQAVSQNYQPVLNEAANNVYPQRNYNHPQPNYNQPQGSYVQPQQIYPPPPPQQATNYQLQPQTQQQPRTGHQPVATDRSGHYEPPIAGIKLSLGNDGHGQKSLLGGSYSPLGIISSILAPVIKRPRVNLNGKLMFGVMLEKGLKFGEDKAHHQPNTAYG